MNHPPIAERHGSADRGHHFLVVFDAQRVQYRAVDVGDLDGIRRLLIFSGRIRGTMDVAGTKATTGQC